MIFVPAASPALPAALSGQLRACKQGVQLVPLYHLFLQQSARELLEEAPPFREEGGDLHVRIDNVGGITGRYAAERWWELSRIYKDKSMT